jgi:hypothetical protein
VVTIGSKTIVYAPARCHPIKEQNGSKRPQTKSQIDVDKLDLTLKLGGNTREAIDQKLANPVAFACRHPGGNGNKRRCGSDPQFVP